MDRLQKKCFIVSAGFHLLLATILVIGPAFFSPKSKPDDLHILDVIPSKLIDAEFRSGNPNAKPPPPAAAAPAQPQVAKAAPPEKVREPDPPKPIKPLPKPDESFEPAKEHKPKLPDVSLKPVVRKKDSAKK